MWELKKSDSLSSTATHTVDMSNLSTFVAASPQLSFSFFSLITCHREMKGWLSPKGPTSFFVCNEVQLLKFQVVDERQDLEVPNRQKSKGDQFMLHRETNRGCKKIVINPVENS